MSDLSKWDIDLRFGQKGENWLSSTLGANAVEVKTERDYGKPSQWTKTGNIAIEYGRDDSTDTGIRVTEASHWVHIRSREIAGQTVYCGAYIWAVQDLENFIYDNWKKYRHVKGGDGNRTSMILLPLSDLWRIHGYAALKGERADVKSVDFDF